MATRRCVALSARRGLPAPVLIPPQFAITEAGPLGFYIVHVQSGRRVTTNPVRVTADGATHLTVRPNFGSVFVFEDAGDGAVRCVFADYLNVCAWG